MDITQAFKSNNLDKALSKLYITIMKHEALIVDMIMLYSREENNSYGEKTEEEKIQKLNISKLSLDKKTKQLINTYQDSTIFEGYKAERLEDKIENELEFLNFITDVRDLICHGHIVLSGDKMIEFRFKNNNRNTKIAKIFGYQFDTTNNITHFQLYDITSINNIQKEIKKYRKEKRKKIEKHFESKRLLKA